MRVAIDTNRLTDLFRGDAELSNVLERCEEVVVPLSVYAELKAGLLGSTRRVENESLLNAFLSKPSVTIVLPSRQTADHYARLVVQLKTAGTPIPINDIWIASFSLEHDLTLVSRDAHFQRIPQLVRLNFSDAAEVGEG